MQNIETIVRSTYASILSEKQIVKTIKWWEDYFKQALKEILPKEEKELLGWESQRLRVEGFNACLNQIKQNAKDKLGIIL